MNLYRISNWSDHFENNRSKTVIDLSWVRFPNRHDGENYTAVVTHEDGAILFSAFVLMVQVASKCDPRGVLVRGNGKPHSAASLSLITRAPRNWFEISIPHLLAHTDWLESKEVSEEWQYAVSGLPPDWHPGDEREEKRREEKKRKDAPLAFSFPMQFLEPFQEAWAKWTAHRQAYKAPKSGWQSMFDEQLKWLAKFDEKTAIGVIEKSLRNSWQGLFDPPASKPPQQKKYAPTL